MKFIDWTDPLLNELADILGVPKKSKSWKLIVFPDAPVVLECEVLVVDKEDVETTNRDSKGWKEHMMQILPKFEKQRYQLVRIGDINAQV